MEVAAEAALVGVGGDTDDHGVAVLPLGEELQRRRLAPQLVGGIVEVGQILDLRYRHEAVDAGSEGSSEDRLFVEDRVEHLAITEPAMEASGDAVHTALAGHVLAEHERVPIGGQDRSQRGVDRLGDGHRALDLPSGGL